MLLSRSLLTFLDLKKKNIIRRSTVMCFLNLEFKPNVPLDQSNNIRELHVKVTVVQTSQTSSKYINSARTLPLHNNVQSSYGDEGASRLTTKSWTC